ncbi:MULTISPECIES: 50S ribosomal protein L17 [unclassified Campylobacter]|uniref:50S ribosomal protein L17 n=1 Tax=unclassified Campylobacter TaxID=2593542 RepID=UPI001237FBE6|nr:MULTISPECIES: 50S ribosomal protein L17 [unclassified Campylobacter]KAA6227659.1 50S ribosomal protein L17 [Campylobacter sp. LR185c]KAA6228845.1 50S ribosomal protein L17 [Campylobacter sp. LR286c]KAA6229026.1 50S ribosomal protein L17 [Campylobacter sp. LR196d]KAA6233909.1 50S ribosomal protein L17 [Campylobacter sp. LR291e]KAA6233994.1 50S ribosomal protein L17 [Campylobacter sp. LR264d]
MRHKHGYRKLGRTSAHRGALFKNLTIALVNSGKIETTLPKAKELRGYVERLITRARVGDFNAHRAVFAHLQDKNATNKLVSEIAPNYKERNGGYTRIIKTRLRRGDAAQMAYIEFLA